MRLTALVLAGAVALMPLVASAQSDPTVSAEAAMQALRDAADSLQAADGARDRVAALTQTVQAYEAGLAALREGLRQATIRESAIENDFDAQREKLSGLLGVLESIEAAPEPVLLLHPDGPLGTVRAGMILSDVTPAISHEAGKLRAALEEVAALRDLQQEAMATLQSGLTGVQAARTALSQAVSDRTDLPNRLITDDAAMQNLISSADTLESFANGLMTTSAVDNSVEVALPDFAAAKGHLALPVLGRVIRRFDEADAAGVRRPGWVLAARPLTLVTTPWPATIRYLGPLLDYGQVAVLEPGEGYLLVLAGLGQLFGHVGDVIPKGTPIGLMGGAAPSADQGILISSPQGGGAEASESLYIELRWNGSPEDPENWFAGPNE